MLEWIKEHWKKEWPEMKDAPVAFTICSFVGFIIGIVVAAIVFEHVIIVGKDSTITLLQQKLTLLQSEKDELSKELQNTPSQKAKDAKQDIRSFFESIDPNILKKIDAGQKEFHISITDSEQTKLLNLSKYPDFDKFLSFEQIEGVITFVGGKNRTGVGGEYVFSPKDALIKNDSSLKSKPGTVIVGGAVGFSDGTVKDCNSTGLNVIVNNP
jgi:hypothetical protein